MTTQALAISMARGVIAEFNEIAHGKREDDCPFVRELRQQGFGDVETARVIRVVSKHFGFRSQQGAPCENCANP